MSFTNNDNTTAFGRDTSHTGGAQSDRFDSSVNTGSAGSYGQEASYNATNSNINNSLNSPFNSSRDASSPRTDHLSSGIGMDRGDESDRFGSHGGNSRGDLKHASVRSEFDKEFENNTTGRPGKAPMGDKLRGGAEKFVGNMTRNTHMQQRGQERKMGEFETNDF